MRPLNDFIMGVDPTLSTDEVCLILSALILTYYHESKSSLKKLMEIIKEKNLVDIFKTANDKADELKNTFTKFIESLNISLHKMTNIMAYTFIIPIIPMLVSFSHGNITNEDVTIFSDSEYVVKTLTLNWRKRKNNDLWDQIIPLITKNIHFKWCRGHAGNIWNEYCDKLANDAYRISYVVNK
jgi:hypothetical protein